jgi:hypothetical protein
MNQLGHFEQNLLTELREVVAEQAAAPQPRRALPRKRLALATAGVGLLATGLLVGVPAMDGDRTPAAYAVTPNDDGTVTVVLNRPEDPEGLERELATHGITAEVDFTPPGKMCQATPPRHETPRNSVLNMIASVEEGRDAVTLRPADFEGRTLVLEGGTRPAVSEKDVLSQFVFYLTVTNGPIAPCVLVDAPAGW